MVLQTKIQLAIAKVDSLAKSPRPATGQRFSGDVGLRSTGGNRGRIGRVKYAARGRHPLGEIIEEMEKWQARFDRSWFMITMVQSPSLDKSVVRDPAKLSPAVI